MTLLDKYLGEVRNMNTSDKLQQNLDAIISSASDIKDARKASELEKKYKNKGLSKQEEEWVYKTIRRLFKGNKS